MRGSLRKQSKTSWEVRLYVPDPSGGTRRKSFTVKGTKRDAERFRAQKIAEILDGRYHDPAEEPVEVYAEGWLQTIKPTVRENTHDSYSWLIDTYVTPIIGDTPMGKVTPQQLNKLYADLSASGGKSGGGLSARTVRYVHTVIHRMFKDAVKWGDLTANPADSADPPKQARDTSTKREWSEAEVETFLDAVRDTEMYPLWHLAVFTGMRRSELCGLTWEHVDLDRGRLEVQQTLIKVGSKHKLSQPKTASGRRVILLDPVTVEVLRQVEGEGGFVFRWGEGQPVLPDWVSKEFRRISDQLDVSRITFHGLRHTHASLAFRAKVSPKIVQERLGHSNISITMDLYTHTEDDIHEQAAEDIAGLVGGTQRDKTDTTS